MAAEIREAVMTAITIQFEHTVIEQAVITPDQARDIFGLGGSSDQEVTRALAVLLGDEVLAARYLPRLKERAAFRDAGLALQADTKWVLTRLWRESGEPDGELSGKTPGRAAFEARITARCKRMGIDSARPSWGWANLSDEERTEEEAGAQAAIDAGGE